jgi:hypothetical protein
MSFREQLSLSSVPAALARPANFGLVTQEGGGLSFEARFLSRAAIDILSTWTIGEQRCREFQKEGAREWQVRCKWNIVEKGQESSEVVQIDDPFRNHQPRMCQVKHNLPQVYGFTVCGTAIATLGAHAGFPIGSTSVR